MTDKRQNDSGSGPKKALRLASAAFLSLLTACGDSGGRAFTPAGGSPKTGPVRQMDFGLRSDLSLGVAFIGDVKHEDLNGDGFQDLIETNFLPMKVTISLGQPDGSFVMLTELQTIGHAWRLATGDFDGDDLIDIAVASHTYRGTGSAGVQVFLQRGSAGFSAANRATLATAENPTDLAAAPLSGAAGDAGPDELFVAIRDEAELARMSLNASNLGQLDRTGALDSSNLGAAGGPFSVAVVDIGGDGLLDIVVGEDRVPSSADRVISFARSADDPANFGPAAVVMSPVFKPVVDNVGHLDGEGFDDVAIAQVEGDRVYLLTNDASGLSQASAIEFGAPTTSLIFPDLDGDGLAEAVATTLNEAAIQVRPGVAPMAWGDPVHYNVGPVPRAIDTISLPGDDIPDLLCGNAQTLSTLVGLADPATGDAIGAFRAARGYHAGVSAPTTVKLGNLDNDINGTLDAVVIGQNQESIAFLEGMGDGSFERRALLPLDGGLSDYPAHVALSDLNADGRLDVVAAVTHQHELRIYRNNGRIDEFLDPAPQDVLAVGSEPVGIAVADLDGNTSPDILVSNSGDNTIQALINDGSGNFTAMSAQSVGFQPLGIVAMDFDSDDDMDAAVFGRQGSAYMVALYANDGDANFSMDETHSVDGPSNSMATGDFNEDGQLDIVIGQTLASSTDVHVLLNQGGLDFLDTRVTVDRGPGTVMVTDVDNDQNLDLLVLTTPGELRAVFGDGNGGFGAAQPEGVGALPVAKQTIGAAFGDVNGDGLGDVLFASPITPLIWVGLNASVDSPAQ